VRGENDLRHLRAEFLADIGRTGLHDHRMPLRRARHIERPAHGEMLALVIEHVQPRRVEIAAGVFVANERVLVPAVPQAAHDLGKFGRAVIAVVMREVRLLAEIERFLGIGGGDEIPARASAADVIERGELARDVQGLVIGRGRGGDEADVLCHGGKRREQRDRLEARDIGRNPALPLRRPVPHGRRVGEKQQIELAALGRPRKFGVVGKIDRRRRIGIGMAPGGDVMAGGVKEGPQFHLFARHRQILAWRWIWCERGVPASGQGGGEPA
jgi:hypothetical protein